MRHRDDGDMDRMRQGIPRGFNGATTTCNGENSPDRVRKDGTGASRGRNPTRREPTSFPLPAELQRSIGTFETDGPFAAKFLRPKHIRLATRTLRSGGTHMGQRRSKLDRHAAELLALRRVGATVAQLTRWLREERGVAATATTVARRLDRAPDLDVGAAPDGFDARGIARILAERSRAERFPRYAPSVLDPFAHDLVRMRAGGASIGECHRVLRERHGLCVARSTVSRWLSRHG